MQIWEILNLEKEIQSIEFSPLELTSKFIISTSEGKVTVFKLDQSSLTIIDNFDIFKDPHGLNEGEDAQNENPYSNMYHKTQAKFSTWDKDVYLCMANSLQYVYVVNSSM